MNNLFKKIATAFVGIAMAVGVGVAVSKNAEVHGARAEDATITLIPNAAATGSSSTTYITSALTFSYEDVSWTMNQFNPSTLQVKTNQSNASNEFNFFTGVFPGNVNKVVISFDALTLKDTTNTGMYLALKSTAYTSLTTSGGNQMTWDSTELTLTWTGSSTSGYQAISFYQNGKVATGTNTLKSIAVTYEKPSATTVDVEGVELDKESANLEVDDTLELNATILPSNASNKAVSWESDDETVATVEGGVVTGHKAGTANITVTTEDGDFEDSCEVTVFERNYGTEQAPLTVNQAIALLDELGDNVKSKQKVYVTGVVASSGAASNGRRDVWLYDDDGNEEQAFELYSTTIGSGVTVGDDADALKGYTVVANGWAMHYVKDTTSTYEFTNKDHNNQYDNAVITSAVAPVAPVVLDRIELDTTNATLEFDVGETFSTEGLVVTAYYTDDTNQEVTNYTHSDPDMTTDGLKTITITYVEDEVEKTAEYDIEVVAPIPPAPTMYNVTFNGNGAQGSMEPLEVEAGHDVTTSPANGFTVPTDKEFGGWSLTADGDAVEFPLTVNDDVELFAIWNNVQPTIYHVTFNGNGAEGSMDALEVEAGQSVASAPTNGFTVPQGKEFGGWSLTADGDAVEFPLAVNADVELFAIWNNVQPTVYHVTFNGNGAQGSMDALEVEAGQSVASAPVNGFTVPTDKEFGGWSLTADGDAVEFPLAVNADVELFAIWNTVVPPQPTMYHVTFNGNGAQGSMDALEVEAGQNVASAPVNGFTVPTDKEFGGWSLTADGDAVEFPLAVNADVELFAIWNTVVPPQPTAETVEFVPTDFSTTAGELSVTHSPITLVLSRGCQNASNGDFRIYASETMTISAATGYDITKIELDGKVSGTYDGTKNPGALSASVGEYSYNSTDRLGTWTGEASSVAFTGTSQARMSSAKVYYVANGETPTPVTQYTISFDNGDGTGEMAALVKDAGFVIESAPECTFTAPENKVFDEWVDKDGAPIVFPYTVNDNATFIASYKDNGGDTPTVTFTVSFAANGGTGSMADVANVSGDYQLPACGFGAPQGKEFAGWYVGDSTELKQPGATIQVTANVTLTAQWKDKEVTPVSTDPIVLDGTKLGYSTEKVDHDKESQYGGVTYVAHSVDASSSKANYVRAYTNGQGSNRFSDDAMIMIGAQGAYIYNSTALPAGIAKIELVNNSSFEEGGQTRSPSTNVKVAVEFGNAPMTTALTSEGKQLSAENTVFTYTPSEAGNTYFRLQVMSAHNAQFQMKIYFGEPEEGGDTPTPTPTTHEVNVAQALEAAKALAPAATSTDTYKVTGKVVTEVQASEQTAGTYQFSIADTDDGEKLLVYWASATTAPKQGDTVEVTGILKNFVKNDTSTYEIINGSVVIKESGGDTPATTFTVSFSANGGTGTMASVTGQSGEYTLPANGFTAPAGKEFEGWKVNGQGDLLQPGAKITLTADVQLVAQWKDAQGGEEEPDVTVTRIEITFKDDGKIIAKGSDLSGISVRVFYSDGTFADIDLSKVSVSGYDATKAGAQTITVTYSEGGKTATETFSVTTMDKLGCSGSVIAGSAIISLTTLLGAGLLMLKKKKLD